MVSNYRNQVYAAAKNLFWKLPLPFAWKLRLRSKLFRLLNLSPQFPDYPAWIAAYDTLTGEERQAIRAHIAAFARKPLISVLMPVYNTPEPVLRSAIESIPRQLYPHWELCVADDASTAPHVRPILEQYARMDSRIKLEFRTQNGHISHASNSCLAMAAGDYVALFDHDDELSEHALYFVALEINEHPQAKLIFSDEDKIGHDGRRFGPYFKPDFSPDLFLAQNSISHLGVYETTLLREIGGFRPGVEGSQDWDLALRCTERIGQDSIRHIPRVLYHWRAISGSAAMTVQEKPYALEAALKAIQQYLDRNAPGSRVVPAPQVAIFQRVVYPLPKPEPLVSILIPSRDGYMMLSRCVESIRSKTDYPSYEILIIDNGSTDSQSLRYLEQLQAKGTARVLRDDGPFNFSALNNRAAHQAKGEVLVLLNNDIEVISPGWLAEMVSHAVRPEIGVVGAKLYYPNDTIQHAGIVVGMGGVAGHSHLKWPRSALGNAGDLWLARNPLAVTAACCAVRKQLYLDMGGLNEQDLPNAYNDVDFCLRLAERGFRILWTPHAELYHHESASRGYEDTPEKQARFAKEVAYMQKRWGDSYIARDPAWNPNLALHNPHHSLAWPPRVARPWSKHLMRVQT